MKTALVPDSEDQTDCLQPSIFFYFYSIVERADIIARENTKRES